MKKTYHLCLSSGGEVMFRSREDFIRGINCLCLGAHNTGSILLAYVFMSNHIHLIARTDDPEKLMIRFRYAYNKYFNTKYKRKGKLGEDRFFKIELQGLYHLLTAIAYVLRNPVHHGICSTPFGYEFSSIRGLFKKEFGWQTPGGILPRKSAYRFLPSKSKLPKHFQMNIEGMILPETVIDVQDFEHQFSTARSFLYYMNRLSGEEWAREQQRDQTCLAPITLESIEEGVKFHDINTMLRNEHGRANYTAMTDTMLCYEIDNFILPKYGAGSVYKLKSEEREELVEMIRKKYCIPALQAKRCLAIL
jgi:REP element-mobilizing transposase RayT